MAKRARKQVRKAAKRKGKGVPKVTRVNKLIGQRIRRERLRRKLTLRQLADRTKLTSSQLSQVELGKNAASIRALVRIADSLGVRASVLLSDV